MVAELIIAPEALQDLQVSYRWYEDCRPGLGEEYLSCVDACIQSICCMPGLYPPVHEKYRRALVRRFPFAVYYEYIDETVIVYSIFHTSQDPKKWQKRIS